MGVENMLRVGCRGFLLVPRGRNSTFIHAFFRISTKFIGHFNFAKLYPISDPSSEGGDMGRVTSITYAKYRVGGSLSSCRAIGVFRASVLDNSSRRDDLIRSKCIFSLLHCGHTDLRCQPS